MKKVLVSLALISLLSCGSDCEINSQKITDLSAEITILNAKIDAATQQATKDAYQNQINVLEAEITAEANKCE